MFIKGMLFQKAVPFQPYPLRTCQQNVPTTNQSFYLIDSSVAIGIPTKCMHFHQLSLFIRVCFFVILFPLTGFDVAGEPPRPNISQVLPHSVLGVYNPITMQPLFSLTLYTQIWVERTPDFCRGSQLVEATPGNSRQADVSGLSIRLLRSRHVGLF